MVSSSYHTNLKQFILEFSLSDIWRLRNPDKEQFTWREKSRSGLIQCRLDYFLVSKALEYEIAQCNIKPGLLSDHSLICLKLILNKSQKWGKGTWKFNNMLLCDKQYVALIKESLQNIKNNVTFSNKNTFWEYIKCQLRTDTISYSIHKNKTMRKEMAQTEIELTEIERTLAINNELQTQEYALLKRKWKNLHNMKTQGAILRSKAKFMKKVRKVLVIF